MEPEVAAAVIALVASVLVAGANIGWTASENRKIRAQADRIAEAQSADAEALEKLKHRLDMEAKEEEWHLEERKALAKELRRYRLPLFDAANDLGHRIKNIRNDSFLSYLASDSERRDVALRSTAFRVARYFAVLEIIYEQIGFLPFEREDEANDVVAVLGKIGSTFASDKYDRDDRPWYRARFMIWREEQRAIGEIARQSSSDADRDALIGFASFTENWDGRIHPWFARFVEDLESGFAVESTRLRLLQSHLSELVRLLDIEGRFKDPKIVPEWIKRAEAESSVEQQTE